MPIRSVTLRILGDSKEALAAMKVVNAEADKLEKRKVKVNVGVELNKDDVAKVKSSLTALSKYKTEITLSVKVDGMMAALFKIKAELAAIRSMAAGIKITPNLDIGGFNKAVAQLKSMNIAARNAAVGVMKMGEDTKKTDTLLSTIFRGGGNGFGAWGRFFTGKFVLFGGLATIGTIHLLVDVVAEFLAVIIPASVALFAFGVAGSDAIKNIINHMTNLHTVMDATKSTIPPMTSAMEKLHLAVQPAVYQIFGDALSVMNAKTGVFNQLAKGTASVLEQLASRMAVALMSSKGMGEFMRNAVPDVAKLGDSFANLFAIFGNILHVMPGYAQVLLAFGDGLLHVLEIVSRIAEPVLGVGLAIHGFIVWAGLGATVALLLGKAIVWLGATALGGAIKTFATFLADLIVITATEGLATGATFALAGAMAVLDAVNPLIWVGALLGGLAALVFWFSKSESATQKWGDALQKNIDNATSVAQGLHLTYQAQNLTVANLAKQQMALAKTTAYVNEVNLHTGVSSKVVTQAYAQQAQKTADATQQAQRFSAEAQFNTGRLLGLDKAFHQTAGSMGLITSAGITMSEWQNKSAEGWAIIVQQINATIKGYQAMGQSGGTLNNDLAVMDRYTTDQYQAMQKLNQAWSQFTSDLTAGQTGFDTYAQGLHVLSNNASKASVSLGSARLPTTSLGTAIDGLTKKDIALNQAFTQQVTNTSSLIATWRTAGINNRDFTTGVKDSIAPMLKYARGSQEATAQLVGLAEQAGYSGPVALKNLTKWLGNTSNATSNVKKITNEATVQESLLTGSMQAQGSYIANQLLRDINQAIIQYDGVTKAAMAYGKAIAEDGRNSDAARGARTRLINDIIASGKAAGDSTKQIAAMITKVLHIPPQAAIRIVESGVGKFSISGTTGAGGQKFGGNFPGTTQAAKGLFIDRGTTPTADDVLIRASKGELIVPTNIVNTGAVDHLRGMIPGFASGGIAGPFLTGNKAVLSGDAAVAFNHDFINILTSAMESQMTAAMKAAIAAAKAAAAAAAAGGFGGHGVTPSGPLQSYARALVGKVWPGASEWAAFADIVARESGWNVHARNPTSGAYGIPQALPPGKMASAGADWATNGFTQLRWMVGYIRSRWGDPLRADANERSQHWYGKGLRNGVFTSPTTIGVGDVPEVVNITPLAGPNSGGRGGDIYITVQGDTNPDMAALRIMQILRSYRTRHGGIALNLG